MRAQIVRKAILEILERASPYALPESQLRTELDGIVRPPAGTAEFDETMLFLQTRGMIATIPDPLDDELVKWTIKESGVAALRH